MLDENQLDFAVIEGRFSKTKYDHYLMRMELFVGTRAPRKVFPFSIISLSFFAFIFIAAIYVSPFLSV